MRYFGCNISSAAIDYDNPVTINTTGQTMQWGKHHILTDLAVPADYTVTLPTAVGNDNKSLSWEVADDVTKNITVDGNAAETFGGLTSRIFCPTESFVALSDGANITRLGGTELDITAFVFLTNTQGPISNAVYTKILFDDTDYDSTGMFNVGTNDLTVKVPGKYRVDTFVTASGDATFKPDFQQTVLYRNGTADQFPSNEFNPARVFDNKGAYSIQIEAAANDTFAMYVYVANASNPTILGDTGGGAHQTIMTITKLKDW